MIEIGRTLICLALYIACIASHPHYSDYNINPLTQGYGLFGYSNQIPSYNTYLPSFSEPDLSLYFANHQPLNLLAEVPQVIGSKFSVLPIYAVPENNVNMVSSANILGVSQKKPMLTIETEGNSLLQCIPGVRIQLEQPMWIYSTKKTSIVFPSEVLIYHGDYRIPLRVGAVIAPVSLDSFFYSQVPVEVTVVYAVPLPSKPLTVESVSSRPQGQADVSPTVDNQSIIVESNDTVQAAIAGIFEAPANVTIVEFPNEIASPAPQFINEDEELVNRNPPEVLAPAGIVQSTQPEVIIEPFHNSKESPVLIELKQEKLKQKLSIRGQQNNKINENRSENVKF